VGIEFLCPPVPLPLATLGFKRCLHIVWQDGAYMSIIEGHRLLHIVKGTRLNDDDLHAGNFPAGCRREIHHVIRAGTPGC